MLESVCAGGAAVFRALEDDNILKQGFQLAAHGTYYKLYQSDQASLQFKYWLVTNKHDYKKMITFFNMTNQNKAVKETQKVLLDKIAENQKLFIPMIAKVFDLKESSTYDSVTEE